MSSDIFIFLIAMLIGFVCVVAIDILSDTVCRMFPKIDKWFENMSGLEGYSDEQA